jgi:hypothetical protein
MGVAMGLYARYIIFDPSQNLTIISLGSAKGWATDCWGGYDDAFTVGLVWNLLGPALRAPDDTGDTVAAAVSETHRTTASQRSKTARGGAGGRGDPAEAMGGAGGWSRTHTPRRRRHSSGARRRRGWWGSGERTWPTTARYRRCGRHCLCASPPHHRHAHAPFPSHPPAAVSVSPRVRGLWWWVGVGEAGPRRPRGAAGQGRGGRAGSRFRGGARERWGAGGLAGDILMRP